jgi:hypothetical protein
MPDIDVLNQKINDGYRFIAYSIDAVFLTNAADFNLNKSFKD